MKAKSLQWGCIASAFVVCQASVMADQSVMFVSSFAAGEEGAIHAYELDSATGQLKLLRSTGDVEHPFFLALSPDRRFLYSIHGKTFGGKEHEQVAAFRIADAIGGLQLLNRQSSRGTASCYLDVDATGRTVVVANYSTGSVASFPVREDGSLGKAQTFIQHQGSSVNESRQAGPHAHSIVVSPDNRFVFAADLGLDQIRNYRLDPKTATLSTNSQAFVRTPPGGGPRHLTFHPNGRLMYVINELTNSVTSFEYVADSGMLIERQTISTLPADFEGTSYCADLKITPDGRFLYGTNRGHDSIAAYAIGGDGELSLLAIEPSLGNGPQNLAISEDGRLLICANMPGNNVAVFHINPATGELKSAGEPVAVTSPSCLKIL